MKINLSKIEQRLNTAVVLIVTIIKYNEDNKEVEVEVGMQMKANMKTELVMKLDKEEKEEDE